MTTTDQSSIREILRIYRGAFIAAALFSLFASLLTLTIPLYLINVFTHVFASLSVETLILLTVVALGALLLQSALELVRGRILTRVSQAIDARLGRQVLAAGLRRAAGGNEHSAQAMRDVSELRALIGGPELYRLIEIPLIPVFIGVLYLLHPLIGHIALGGGLLLLLLAFLNEIVTRQPLDAGNHESLRGFNRVEDYMRNADVVAAMGMGPDIAARWQRDNATRLAYMQTAADRAGLIGNLARLVRMVLQIAILGGGTYLFLQHDILSGTIIAASILMARALAPVESAIGTWKNLVSAKAAYGRLNKLLQTKGVKATGSVFPVPEGRLALEQAIVSAPNTSRLLLKRVSFELTPGEMLGVIGPSGAGKSTLGKLLVGVLKSNGGSVRLDGMELRHWEPEALGRHIGYLPQDVQLFNGSVAENIARMDQDAALEDVLAAAHLAGVHDLIARLPNGYETVIGEGGLALSGGQKQHIGLARAYYGYPRLVILDEPNSNLDLESESALRRLLQEGKRLGLTQIVISHHTGTLEGADKMLLLREGVVDLFGPKKDVIATMNGRRQAAQGASVTSLRAEGGR